MKKTVLFFLPHINIPYFSFLTSLARASTNVNRDDRQELTSFLHCQRQVLCATVLEMTLWVSEIFSTLLIGFALYHEMSYPTNTVICVD